MTTTDQRARVRLGAIVAGRRVDSRETASISTPTGSVEVATLDDRLLSAVLSQDPQTLASASLQEIVNFLTRVGRYWADRDYVLRQTLIRNLQRVYGLSSEAATVEVDLIGWILSRSSSLYDSVDSELGSRFILDEWIRRDDAYVRAYPRGRSVHLLAGNVAVSGVVSIVRALLTKNVCVVKPASEDLLTPLALVSSFLDADPSHPVSRATSVVYWQHDSPLGRRLVGSADVVCAWGGAEAIAAAHGATSPEAGFEAFGPKRSLAVVDTSANVVAAARGVAHDVSFYDQRACFSVQSVYVLGDLEPFQTALVEELTRYSDYLPPALMSVDDEAAVTFARLEDSMAGRQMHTGGAFRVIVGDPPTTSPHPLRRTVYLIPITSLSDMNSLVDNGVQTVAVYPWELSLELRDGLASRGVSRVVEVGLTNVFRLGGTHDGRYPMRGLVRIVSNDARMSEHGKAFRTDLDQTRLLERSRSLLDLGRE